MKGAPDDPMTLHEILAKFSANMEWGLRAQKERADVLSRLVSTKSLRSSPLRGGKSREALNQSRARR